MKIAFVLAKDYRGGGSLPRGSQWSFSSVTKLILFHVYIDVNNRKRARAIEGYKKQRRPISLAEDHKNFIAVVKKKYDSVKKKNKTKKTREQEHKEHFLH